MAAVTMGKRDYDRQVSKALNDDHIGATRSQEAAPKFKGDKTDANAALGSSGKGTPAKVVASKVPNPPALPVAAGAKARGNGGKEIDVSKAAEKGLSKKS